MSYRGHIENGIVVLDEPIPLPEGTTVTVDADHQAAGGAGCSRRSLEGLWADLGVDVSDEDIAEARREMWGGFPREDIV